MKQHIKTSPEYRQEHSLAYKVITITAAILIWFATITAALMVG